MKIFESSPAFFKATQIKRDESDLQSLTKLMFFHKTKDFSFLWF